MSDWPPIVDVLAQYGFEIPPARGTWTRIRCIFHDDKVASAAYSVQLNGYSCLACGVKGDAIGLIRDREGCDYAQALKLAGEWTRTSDSEVRAITKGGGRMAHSSRYRIDHGQEIPARLRGGSLFGD